MENNGKISVVFSGGLSKYIRPPVFATLLVVVSNIT